MARTSIVLAIPVALSLAGLGTLAMAASPAVFGKSSGGVWELSGIDGAKSPVRSCIPNLAEFAQIQHRGKACGAKVVRETAESVTYNYQCSGGDFGSSLIKFVTPKNFRIETQGISGGLPFSYVVQARRIGDCQSPKSPVSH